MEKTPRELRFRLPAEWEKHSSVWLAWPNDETAFPNLMNEVEKDYCLIIKNLVESEKVNLIILEKEKNRVEELLQNFGIDLSKVDFQIQDYNDVWVRDYAPLFLTNNKELILIKWNYNGYGKADDPYFVNLLKDNQVFEDINKNLLFKMFQPGIILEGGAIEVNGNGTLITTEQCLLNPNRNSNLNKEQTEKYLKDYLGVTNIIWLKEGLINDHTDGHIDELVKFVNPNTIVCAYEEDENDPNFKILDNNYKTLKDSVDENGNKFNLIKLQVPHMNYNDGEKAPVSYTNFYIGNSVILVPTYNDSNDQKALNIIQSFFPERKVVGIDCLNIIYGGGALHCITMQQPEI